MCHNKRSLPTTEPEPCKGDPEKSKSQKKKKEEEEEEKCNESHLLSDAELDDGATDNKIPQFLLLKIFVPP